MMPAWDPKTEIPSSSVSQSQPLPSQREGAETPDPAGPHPGPFLFPPQLHTEEHVSAAARPSCASADRLLIGRDRRGLGWDWSPASLAIGSQGTRLPLR